MNLILPLLALIELYPVMKLRNETRRSLDGPAVTWEERNIKGINAEMSFRLLISQ
jgi:hypothetical protein